MNTRNVAYTVTDDVRVISDHDLNCLNGINTDLPYRYTTNWIGEYEELYNPYLMYLRSHTNNGSVPYTNNAILTGHKNSLYYRPSVINIATQNNLVCGRDGKWNLNDQTIYREECDCGNFFRVVIAVYRFWLCTFTTPLDNLGIIICLIFM